jgi:hypothetical protein
MEPEHPDGSASTSDETEGSWSCPTCGERNEKQFDECWKCAKPAAEDARPVATTKPPATDEPPKRFQFHLSTAVICQLVAGVLLGLNIANNGWPWRIEYSGYLQPREITLDFLVCLWLVLAVASVLEWRISRRERRE